MDFGSDKMKISDLSVFTISSSISQFAGGLIGPFYIIFVQKLGGGSIENLGIAFGILGIFSAITAYFAGKYSDKLGRKPFLILTGYLSAILFLLYLLVKTNIQLFVLQAVVGVVGSIFSVISAVLLADITHHKIRGMQIGLYNLIVGIFTSLALIAGGFLIGKIGFVIVFYIFSGLTVIATTMLFLIRETVKK